ncbi:hypothetical protein CAK78_00780 [Aeromonas sp. A35_P]|nr:hypothetical protein [Aeromonas sp. A35_P]OZG43745.1 hypothetical protein CAK78_00780 [Aeromonas sp. A35_P]
MHQPAVTVGSGEGADAKGGGELAQRGKALARRKLARGDGLLDGVYQLLDQGTLGRIEGEGGHTVVAL